MILGLVMDVVSCYVKVYNMVVVLGVNECDYGMLYNM